LDSKGKKGILPWSRKRKGPIIGLLLLLGMGIYGPTAAAAEDCPPLPQVETPSAELTAAYEAALAAAKYPDRSKISRNLTPIVDGGPALIEQGSVLLLTWSKCTYFANYKKGDRFNLYGDTWCTLVPRMQDFCRGIAADQLRLRIAQRLGMPPTANNNVFVAIWVPLTAVFRPCPDPEIYDGECVVRIPMLDDVPPTGESPPWRDPQVQQAGHFTSVSPDHLEWMYQWWLSSYQKEGVFNKFPWTALGYTYDWAPGSSHIGFSEYLVPAGSAGIFESMTATEDYCAQE